MSKTRRACPPGATHADPTRYSYLDLSGIDLGDVLAATTHAKVVLVAMCHGIEPRAITTARQGRRHLFVLQLGADLEAGTVDLATSSTTTRRVTLAAEFADEVRLREQALRWLLAVHEAHPADSLTAALADALILLLYGTSRMHRHGVEDLPRRTLDAVLLTALATVLDTEPAAPRPDQASGRSD